MAGMHPSISPTPLLRNSPLVQVPRNSHLPFNRYPCPFPVLLLEFCGRASALNYTTACVFAATLVAAGPAEGRPAACRGSQGMLAPLFPCSGLHSLADTPFMHLSVVNIHAQQRPRLGLPLPPPHNALPAAVLCRLRGRQAWTLLPRSGEACPPGARKRRSRISQAGMGTGPPQHQSWLLKGRLPPE